MNIVAAGLTLAAAGALVFGLAGYLSARREADSRQALARRGIAEFEELLDLESRI